MEYAATHRTLSSMSVRTLSKTKLAGEQAVLLTLLRELRHDAGLRQSDLAIRLGESQSFVSKYESGERRLDFVELRYVCVALGVSLAEFTERYEERLRGNA